jgi:6-pyruvoyltetrahydropterin/6-carboxytetrahydropterin synthase
MGKHLSTKHYGHNIGLSAVFRQPNADHSHCHLLHGYSLAFTFTFGCDELDNKNKTAIDKHDPHMDKFM